MAKGTPGIRARHPRTCRSRDGAKCNCTPTWEATVWSNRDGKRITKNFPTAAAARAWRSDTEGAVRRGARRASTGLTVRAAADALLAGMEDGSVRNRNGDPYKPSALREYRLGLDKFVVPAIGSRKLADVTRRDVQALVDQWLADGREPQTVKNRLKPLRVVYRRAIQDGDVQVSPCEHLRLPAARGRRDRVAEVDEAMRLLDALPPKARAVFAGAFFAGLRLGELRALKWGDVDLKDGLIHVRRALDATGETIPPKSRAGIRDVPIIQPLRLELERIGSGAPGAYVFHGRTPDAPFSVSPLWRASTEAFASAGLEPIGLHEARHTFASWLIAANVGIKELTSLMGHGSVAVTLDVYGKLLAGSLAGAGRQLEAWVAASAGDSFSGRT